MNTTELIAQWTMNGARRDVDGRFRVIADKQATPEPTAAAGAFLIKGADQDSWQALKEETKNH
jgi:hypothetical protein